MVLFLVKTSFNNHVHISLGYSFSYFTIFSLVPATNAVCGATASAST